MPTEEMIRMSRRAGSDAQGIALVVVGALVLIVGAVIVCLYVGRSPARPPAVTSGAETAAGKGAEGVATESQPATTPAASSPAPQPASTPSASSGEPVAPMSGAAGGLTPVSPSVLGDGGAPVGFALKQRAQGVAGSAPGATEGGEAEGDP